MDLETWMFMDAGMAMDVMGRVVVPPS